MKARTHKHQALIDEAIARTSAVVPEITPTARVPLPPWLTGPAAPDTLLARNLLLRMLFSCVVGADFLDTSAHFVAAPARTASLCARSGSSTSSANAPPNSTSPRSACTTCATPPPAS
ncbi:hypothetical protein [Kitasatospora sp. NPDC058478]|uniref:hypothetical protein n=1 Tax=unclassified Kitasatospora TaxID=2633591 RepID=UPI0036662635